jgi:hypothetical protein
MRGKFGGSVIQVNANGLFVRNTPIPTQPGTSFQVTQQAIYAQVVGEWSDITQSQRDAWIAFAATSAGEYQNRVGETRHYTGQQLFIKLNLAAYSTSFPISAPPLVPSFTMIPVDSFSVLMAGGSLFAWELVFGSPTGGITPTVKFYATTGISVGIQRPRRSLFKLFAQTSDSIVGETINLNVEYEARFGKPTIGSKVFCLIIFTDPASGFEFTNSQDFAVVVEAL